MMVTASMVSFLCNLDPGFSTSLRMWVIPALNPAKAVKFQGFFYSYLGNDLILPLWCFVLLRGANPKLP